MDGFLKWHTGTETLEQKKYKQLVGRLEAGRHKLTPIVDDIILSAVEGIQKGDNKFLNDYVLTVEQYQDVIWASQILKEIEYQYKTESKIRKWPNTDVIVNNVSVDYKNRMTSARGKSIVIDETDIVQLLELYEQMGEVIQKIIEEANQQNENARDKSRHHVRSAMNIKPSEKNVVGSSGELNKKHSRPTTDSDSDKCEEGTNVFVKIQCISDPSEVERDEQSVLPTDCDRQSTPHYHIRLGGEPVTLKVNQNNVEEGAVYCINTGTNKEDNDIKIVIKQCPECFSTVIGSTSKIRGMLGESHESITLHGKGPRDPNDMAYSSDETDSFKGDKRPEGSKLAFGRSNSTCPCHKPSSCRCHESERIRINIIGGPCPCDDNICLQNKTQSSSSNSTKMDVLIDAENVDKSTVKFNGKKESSVIKPTKKKSLIPLMRKRICSSMEFDVTTVHTRLRDQEIEHTNPHIVVELKKMGVDHLLRACRPAKCCRKAILNERQRTALPYCVSLKSLPLLGNDIQVIEQSYDMSVKKIKNSLDLTQNHKDALAYYVSLGRDDFRPNINFPWVIPVYDVRLDEVKNRSTHNDRFFILKKSIAPDESKSMSLIDGDLVWGQSLPLVPQNYKAYYNYSNVKSIKSKDHSPNGSRASTFPSQPPQTSPRTSSISEIPLEDLLYLNNRSGQNTASSSPTSGDSEDPYVPWGPFLVSESSLPTLQEVAQKKEVGQLEAPKEATQRKKDTTKDEPTTCASKPKCVDNLCKTCKSKACETIKKKSCGQGIVIDITKTKSNGNNIIVEAEGHCNKEICELYKNKALVPDNANSSKEKDPCDKRLMFTAKDNIQIVIKNKKIS
ncbi:uncharacterized protein BDFB_005298, partial [Asbolus verrucosus]